MWRDDAETVEAFIIQEKSVSVFQQVTGNIADNTDIFIKKVDHADQVGYHSFAESGIYDPEYWKKREQYIFRLKVSLIMTLEFISLYQGGRVGKLPEWNTGCICEVK